MVSAARISARSCASTSKWTATSSWSPRARMADEGKVPVAKVAEAIKKYGINPNKLNPQHA